MDVLISRSSTTDADTVGLDSQRLCLSKSSAMRKVVLAFDGIQFSETALRWVKQLNQLSPLLVTGVFLPRVNYANLWSFADGVGAPLFVPVLTDDEEHEMEQQVARFRLECEREGMEYRVHKDATDLALPELRKESRYADLVVIGSDKFYQHLGMGEPNTYLKEALHDVECPVIVVPDNAVFPEMNLIAFDGSESSVFAMKMFSYVLPELCQNPTLVVFCGRSNVSYPDESYVREWAARHFETLTFFTLETDSADTFATWISDKTSALVVAGAFARSSLSQLFRKSYMTDLLKAHQLPLFICHK